MGKPNIEKELHTINVSIRELSNIVTDYVSSATGEHKEQQTSQWVQDDNYTTNLNDRDYTGIYVESKINALELKLSTRINDVESGLGEKIAGLKEDLINNKPNYWKIFLILVLPTILAVVLSIIGVFAGIVPTFTKNEWNENSKQLKNDIIVDVEKGLSQTIDKKIGDLERKINTEIEQKENCSLNTTEKNDYD